jgi:hypothetical protein
VKGGYVKEYGSAVVTQRGLPVIRLVVYQTKENELRERLENLLTVGKARKPKGRILELLSSYPHKSVKPGVVERFLKDRN